MIRTSKTTSTTRSMFELKTPLDSSPSHSAPEIKLLVTGSQYRQGSKGTATRNPRCPPMALVVPIALQWPRLASMPDQLRSEAEIMSSKARDPSKGTILRADLRHLSSTTMPLGPRERPRKLCFAKMLPATVASRTKLLTSRISMVLIEFKEATRSLFSGEVDFMIGRQETSMPNLNSALSLMVLERELGKIHLMGLTVGE